MLVLGFYFTSPPQIASVAGSCGGPPDPKEAEKAARESIRLQPTGYFWSYYQLAVSLRRQARYPEAIAALEQTLQMNPAFRSTYVGLGEAYLPQGSYRQALAQFNKARGMGETPGLLALISAVYAARGDREKSLAELDKALARGYRDFAYLDSSPYLAQVPTDARYQKLLRRYRK